MADDLIAAAEHYPIDWDLTAPVELTGAVAVTFTRAGAPPTADATWFAATWADPSPATTRRVQLTVAGSAAADSGAFPGVGDFTTWLRYSDTSSVRIKQAGPLRFR